MKRCIMILLLMGLSGGTLAQTNASTTVSTATTPSPDTANSSTPAQVPTPRLFLTPLAPSNTEAARRVPWRVPTYTLVARGLDLREALNTFAIAEGLSVVMSPEVKGSLSGDFRDLPAGDFLDRLSTLHNLTWYYDGAALYIYGAGEIQTILANLQYMTAEEVRKMLVELGVEDARFPIKTTSNGELIMVSGPPRYVALIGEMIRRADLLREQRTFAQVETRVFPLEHTWADDVTLDVSGPESSATIKGVAQLLQEIMGSNQEAAFQDSTTTNATTQVEDEADAKGAKKEHTFSPIIRAENRLNAVIVRDAATRMPIYEDLIKKLDVPQNLVEIGVTVLELSRNDALDWQLSLQLSGTKSDITGAIGQSVSSLTDANSLSGRGLAGALTYLGSDYTVSASLSALREKGKARNISRTTLLTMNNMAAQMTDTQSYHARVVGTEVATLEEVTAGTTLQIKPRIVTSKVPNRPDRVWLTMELEDGGFESVTVDSMPMTRSSSIETQAMVPVGESILVAGYLRDIQESADWGIPYLRDIPWIGWLFGGTSVNNETVQRMFILTPYVIEVGSPDIVRARASALRDITQEEILEDDIEQSDEEREQRQAVREEQREIRKEANKERFSREEDVRGLRRQIRQDFMTDDHEAWEEFFKLHEDAYNAWREDYRKARADAEATPDEHSAPAEAPEQAPVVPVAPVTPVTPIEAATQKPLTEEDLLPPEAMEPADEALLPPLDDEDLNPPSNNP